LKLLVQRHVVEFASLAPALMEILRTVALQEGFLHAGRRAEASADSDAVYEDEATTGRDAARRLLGLNVSQPTKKELQAAYRSLMRKYHPDVNPDGLEMAKKINRAYGLLLSSVESG
jgi:hypothetical protein